MENHYTKLRSLSHSRLVEALDYNPETGIFTWKDCKKAGRNGMPAGSLDKESYVLIKLDRVRFRAHQLAWLYVYQHLPEKQIDHINGNPSDNRIANLRLANQSENNCNKRHQVNNKLGIKGVRRHGARFQALISKDKKQFVIGSYETAEEAAEAYRAAAEKMHGEFAK